MRSGPKGKGQGIRGTQDASLKGKGQIGVIGDLIIHNIQSFIRILFPKKLMRDKN